MRTSQLDVTEAMGMADILAMAADMGYTRFYMDIRKNHVKVFGWKQGLEFFEEVGSIWTAADVVFE